MKQAFIILLCVLLNDFMLFAQEKPTVSAQEVADKLSNPVSGMISVPLQGNLDYGIGSYNGSKYTTNIQPVIPINLSRKLNLITRYIVPLSKK